MSASPPTPSTRFQLLKLGVLFGILHYLFLAGLSGLIFLLSHVPPKVVNLDAAISAIVAVETVLVAPRKILLWIWPWETTPTGFSLVLTIFNSIVWGLSLASLRSVWQRATR